MHRLTAGRRARQLGVSLVEVLLTLVLLLSLIAASVYSFTTVNRKAALREGTDRFETMLRFARAEAAIRGRKFKITFSPLNDVATQGTAAQARLTWEPDPIGAPGVFEDASHQNREQQGINELVMVEDVRVTGMGAADSSRSTEDPAMDEASFEQFAPIVFYPDGSSDSAEIILASRDADDSQRAAVRMSGITGSVTHELLAEAEEGKIAVKEEKDPANTAQSTTEPAEEAFAKEAPTTQQLQADEEDFFDLFDFPEEEETTSRPDRSHGPVE